MVARAEEPALPSDLAWLAGPLPPDFQLDFFRVRSGETGAPKRVVLHGESRLLVGMPTGLDREDPPPREGSARISDFCNYRCGHVDATRLSAIWRKRPLESLKFLELLPPEHESEDAWEEWKHDSSLTGPHFVCGNGYVRERGHSDVRLHAYGRDYWLGPYPGYANHEVHVWLDAIQQLPLIEHACPQLHFGRCRSAQPDAPLNFRVLNYTPGDVRVARIVEALRASLRSCALTRVSRTRYRVLHVKRALSFEVTPRGTIDRVSGLPPALHACMRKPLADFRTEPGEYIGPVRIEFAVSETELEFPWFD